MSFGIAQQAGSRRTGNGWNVTAAHTNVRSWRSQETLCIWLPSSVNVPVTWYHFFPLKIIMNLGPGRNAIICHWNVWCVMEKIWKGLKLQQCLTRGWGEGSGSPVLVLQVQGHELNSQNSHKRTGCGCMIFKIPALARGGDKQIPRACWLATLPYSGRDSVIKNWRVNSREVGWQLRVVAALSRGPGSVICKSHGGL